MLCSASGSERMRNSSSLGSRRAVGALAPVRHHATTPGGIAQAPHAPLGLVLEHLPAAGDFLVTSFRVESGKIGMGHAVRAYLHTMRHDLGQIMSSIDGTIVATALPTIGTTSAGSPASPGS